MIYNPIFEEEVERKIELKKLKRDIKRRARRITINHLINRVYNLLKRKPIKSLFYPLRELTKTIKAKEV